MISKLKYIKNKAIDKTAWDALVSSASNSNVFCFSWYLDAFCNWDTIILGDYDGAIALPTLRKWMLPSVHQPNFIQKCVWFGNELSPLQKEKLATLIQKHYRLVLFNTNLAIGNTKSRTNLILPLHQSIEHIRMGYSKSLKRNLKRFNTEIVITKTATASEVIDLYTEVWGNLNPQLKSKDYDTLARLINERPENFETVTAVLDNTCIAGAIFLKGRNRLHYILGASSTSGKKENALSCLLDSVLEHYSASEYTFDFEGSSIPSVKSYYTTFGAKNEPFYEVDLSNKTALLLKDIYKRLFKS